MDDIVKEAADKLVRQVSKEVMVENGYLTDLVADWLEGQGFRRVGANMPPTFKHDFREFALPYSKKLQVVMRKEFADETYEFDYNDPLVLERVAEFIRTGVADVGRTDKY